MRATSGRRSSRGLPSYFCKCYLRNQHRAFSTPALLLTFSTFLVVPVLSLTPSLSEIYSAPFRAVHNGFGSGVCATLGAERGEKQFTFEYEPPAGGPNVLPSGVVAIPASSFSLNGLPCNRSVSKSEIVYGAKQPPPRDPRDGSLFAFLVDLSAKSRSVDYVYVGEATHSSVNDTREIEEAQCVFSEPKGGSDRTSPGSFGTYAIRVKDLGVFQFKVPSELPNIFNPAGNRFPARVNVSYFALHFDVLRSSRDFGALCMFEIAVGSEAVDSDDANGNKENENEEKKITTGLIVGISCGAVLLLVAFCALFIFLRRKTRNQEMPESDGVSVEYKTPGGRISRIVVPKM